MASVAILPPFSTKYSFADGFVAESDLNQKEIDKSSDPVKSKLAWSETVPLLLVAPSKALPNLPESVLELADKVPSIADPVEPELQISFVPPLHILSAPSSNFHQPKGVPIGEPGAGCPAFISSTSCAGVRT